jgi:hypothetical protein
MKISTFSLTVALMFIGAGSFTGCMSSDQKKEAAKAQVAAAEDNLSDVKYNAAVVEQKAATAEELKTFKLESELKIKNNEVSIVELKLKMKTPGSALDEVYAKRIDSLETKNKNMKTRMGDYEKIHSDWTKFKRDFNRDLDELGRKLKSLTVDSRK